MVDEFERWWRESGGGERGAVASTRPRGPAGTGRDGADRSDAGRSGGGRVDGSAGGPGRPGAVRSGPSRPAPPGPLDRPTTRKLVRRRLPLEGRIDLHGLTEAGAHERLLSYLRRARDEGLRHVIVITGKGFTASGGRDDGGPGPSAPDPSARTRGVLRRAVPQWFRTEPFRGLVSGHAPASRRDGGEGALYVKLRRGRR